MRNLQQKRQQEFKGSSSRGLTSSTAKEEIVRARLLAELSSLRERHDALRKRAMNYEEGQQRREREREQQYEGEEHERQQRPSSVKVLVKDDSGRGTPFLGQTDRDAIEAFFNDSEDDFMREFNEGRGKYQRNELLDGLVFPQRRE
ncbi:hypothetical protein LSM04_002698 [Trypanosoma melophagium]|uniref:uncharacterized protein n=1 Tax=Trypanosoma melophagium TaxID=715481 RepID=UPI00351AAA54|nr:hypothetical protein LSM04_002698 [Trypanosoma melophagium]